MVSATSLNYSVNFKIENEKHCRNLSGELFMVENKTIYFTNLRLPTGGTN